MHIVLYQWNAYQYQQIYKTLQQLGQQVTEYTLPITNPEDDPDYVDAMTKYLSGHACDCVFSINYFPVLSQVCMETGLPYICWTCDSPLIAMRHNSIYHPCNYLFLFDRMDYLYFQSLGIPHLFYLPLGTSIITENPSIPIPPPEYAVSFIGSLYEKNKYDRIVQQLPPYLQGYLDCALEAQTHIAGGNLLYQLLTPNICDLLEDYCDYCKSEDSFSDLQFLFANTVLGFKAASLNRIRSLHTLSKALLPYRGKVLEPADGVHLFTGSETGAGNPSDLLPLVHVHGPVDYQTEMPEIFRKSRINLNFTIPNIQTGLPLRIWDVMGSGGFLLTNEQAEIPELLTPGKDLETFSSTEELTAKCLFYLNHDTERIQIARQGQTTVQQNYTCKHQLKKLLAQMAQNL